MAENNAINKQAEDLLINKASGDPYVNFQIASTDEFVIGVDDTDSDSFKINQGGASPSAGTNTWIMTSSGERTMALQPSFLAYSGSNQVNKTGNGTVATVILDTEVFDQGSDFNTGTYTFTAPVTGKYILEANIYGSSIGAATTVINSLTTSNGNYNANTGGNPNAAGAQDQPSSAVADMDAADTAYLRFVVNGLGADTAGYLGTQAYTRMSGELSC